MKSSDFPVKCEGRIKYPISLIVLCGQKQDGVNYIEFFLFLLLLLNIF